MAEHKAAIKKHKQDEKKRMINKMNRTKMKNQIKLLRKKVDDGEMDEAKKILPNVISIIDKTVSKGTIHPRTGARYKSRLSKLINSPPAKS
jgi:small subunit ribosomal protein S20